MVCCHDLFVCSNSGNFFFGLINVEGRELFLHHFRKNKIGMHLDSYKPCPFKRGMMIANTKLYFDTSMNDLDLHPRSLGSEKA